MLRYLRDHWFDILPSTEDYHGSVWIGWKWRGRKGWLVIWYTRWDRSMIGVL